MDIKLDAINSELKIAKNRRFELLKELWEIQKEIDYFRNEITMILEIKTTLNFPKDQDLLAWDIAKMDLKIANLRSKKLKIELELCEIQDKIKELILNIDNMVEQEDEEETTWKVFMISQEEVDKALWIKE